METDPVDQNNDAGGNEEHKETTTQVHELGEKHLKERKISWAKLRRVDSLNLEAGRVSGTQNHHSQGGDWRRTLILAFQSIGVIYGDIGTSPLYVYSSTFPTGIHNKDDILGVLSLIIYTIVIIPLAKYVFVVLWANDHGNGGTFALYSLICRHAKVSLIPKEQAEDSELSNYKLDIPSSQLRRAQKVKEKLEKTKFAHVGLLLVTILGVSMVIGDGILTPSISVLSAVSGIQQLAESLNQNAIVGISVAILLLLFSVQRFGTDKVGSTFAPIIFLWFSFIAGIGLYNLFKFEIGILRAFNPKYIIDYFRRNGKKGWVSLGGVVLCITGTEAMFADLGHFSVRSVQISFTGIVFPSLMCAYIGQAAYLTEFPEKVANTFYASIPGPLYWPMFVVAVLAAIIASQAMISGAFAIITQSLSLGCFPRVTVIHTSAKYEGQVYIPEINYLIMVCSVIVTISFRTTEKIGNAYGIAVVSVMAITSFMVSLIMLIIWKKSIWWIVPFYVVCSTVELTYLSAVLSKFIQGGFLPIAFSLFLMSVMGIWHYVHKKRYMYELNNKVSGEYIRDLAKNPDINRIPGIGLLYSELVQGIPPIFPHFVANIPSIHSVLVFVSIKSIPISKVLVEERFLFRQVEPKEYRMFRCVARYGYNDVIGGPEEFEHELVENLKEFVRHETYMIQGGPSAEPTTTMNINREHEVGGQQPARISSGSILPAHTSSRVTSGPIQGAEEEILFIQKARENGVVYLLGETEVVAEQDSSLFKRIIINNVYDFIRRNIRQGDKILSIPRSRLLRVGMTYEV